MMSTQTVSRSKLATGSDPIVHVPLQGELAGFTLAANGQMRTAALLHSLRGSPRMLCEQLFEEAEYALLLQLLAAYPDPLEVLAGDGVPHQHATAALSSNDFWRKVAALSCEVVVQGGYALRPKNSFSAVLPEADDELYLFSSDRLLAAGTTLVANQRLCSVSLLGQDPAGSARLLWEYPLPQRQMALLLTVLDGETEPVLQRAVYSDLAQAALFYGKNWMEREGNLDHALEDRYPALSQEEQERAEMLVRQEFEGLQPLLERLGLSLRRETSYYFTSARPAASGRGGER